ncbi:hypothetical protein M673_21225 (plasmid) [Aureimonas sp. AU20]|nr:hypothetical protein M673_21225 [Aureimonas sp. AU20]
MLKRLPIDPYIALMLGVVALASLLPASGQGAVAAGLAAKLAIAFLFFLYGARLSPQAAFAGLRHWRLHTAVLLSTYALFPLLGLAVGLLVPGVLSEPLYAGILFLCVLPSTVQSSIAFTSIAQGNVAAALCAASASNLLGIFVTPALVALLLHTQSGGFSFDILFDIVLQLLAPFVAGQLLRPLIGAFVLKHKKGLGLLDRGSILLVIYVAFSAGVASGIWHRLALADLAVLVLLCAVLLGLVLAVTTLVSRYVLRFPVEDEIVLIFCGSKKSLASGLPMASVLFAGPQVGMIVLPIMLFHQIQLMVCAGLARRYSLRALTAQDAAALAVQADETDFDVEPQAEQVGARIG